LAYIGNIPAESYASFETETFSVSATANYTLSHAVTNENEIRLVINGVVQQPGSGKAYTASGTTLTLSSATVSGDSMYAVYLGRALQTVNPPNASVGTAQLGSEAVTNAKVASTVITGQTAETSIATDDLILLSDTSASGALKKMTRANFVSGVGETNTPNFRAYRSSAQSFSASTNTDVQFNATSFDSASGFNTSNGKFTVPSGQGGKYCLTTSLRLNNSSVNNEVAIYFYVGSTSKSFSNKTVGGNYPTAIHSDIVSLSAGDEVFVKIYTNVSSPILDGSGSATYTTFEGFKISS